MSREPMVSLGEKIYTKSKEITLIKIIGKGEEGVVYETDSPFVCKVYWKDCIDFYRHDKIVEMVYNDINYKGICWPREIVYNKWGLFIGYIMNRGYGTRIADSILNSDNLIKLFPQWTMSDLISVILKILDKINFLHRNNIIIGDLNAENILIKSKDEIFFVDTDSYQIYPYTCPVGTQLFTPPEIKEEEYSKVIRTFGNEYFAVATLLFMILTLGKTPYGGDTSVQIMKNISQKTYFLNKENYPIWNGHPLFVKMAFFNTFHVYGMNNNETTRYSTEQWIRIFQRYLYLLKKGNINDEKLSLYLL